MLEATKWRMVIRPLESLSLGRALLAVFSGLAVAISTPNRIGEFGGRILYLREESRLEAIPLTFVGSLAQLIATFCLGIPAVVFVFYGFRWVSLPPMLSATWIRVLILVGLGGVLAGFLLVFFKLRHFRGWMTQWNWFSRMDKYFEGLNRIGNKTLKWLLVLSILRFVIFSVQYLILLRVFEVHLPVFQGFWIIALIYLILSIIPSVAVAELGIRGQIGLTLIGLFSANKLGIIAATIGIWLINLVLPALLGTLLLLGIKVYKNPNIVTLNDRDL